MTKPVLQALVLADKIYQDKATNKMVIAGTFTSLIRFKRPTTEPEQNEDASDESANNADTPSTLAAENEPNQTLARLPTHLLGQAGSPSVYVCLTDIRGSTALELRYVDLSTDAVLLKCKLNVNCTDPLRSVELNIPLPELPHPHFGVYSLELLHADELLGSWRVTFLEVEAEQSNPEE